MSRSFILTYICSISMGLSLHTQDQISEKPFVTTSKKSLNFSFEDAFTVLVTLKSHELFFRKYFEIGTLLELVHGPQYLSCTSLDHEPQDKYFILFSRIYSFLYHNAYSKVIFCSENAPEILLFKTIVTPKEFTKKTLNNDSTNIFSQEFDIALIEKLIHLTRDFTFDDLFSCCLAMNMLTQENQELVRTVPNPTHLDLSLADVLYTNRALRTVIEQQKLPERRALARFLFSDQQALNFIGNARSLSL